MKKGIEVEWKKEGNEWIVKMREGVKFNDGK